MARPEEGYPAAIKRGWKVCENCDPPTKGFRIGPCRICGGVGAHTVRAYRWYEPIKILPPRTRRRPDPAFEYMRGYDPRDCEFCRGTGRRPEKPAYQSPPPLTCEERDREVAKFQTDTWYRVF